MKIQLLLLLTLTIFASSCDNLNNKTRINSDKGSTLEEVINNELSSGVRNDTIFLGFTFGMTEKEFYKKLRTLFKENKIYKDKSNRDFFTYDLAAGQYGTFKCTFAPEYFKGKLYKLGISAKPENQFLLIKTATSLLSYFFMRKYGPPTIEQEMKLIDDCKEYIWIAGNRKIKIMCGFSDSRIWYEDLRVLKEKEQLVKKKSMKK